MTRSSIQRVTIGDAIICVRGRDLLIAKSRASAMLGEFAFTLGEDFYPWVAQAASILVPLLKYYIHDGVRKNACNDMYNLLHSAKLAVEKGIAQGENRSYFKQLSGDIILALGEALYSEPETELCAFILGTLNKCLEICGTQNVEDQVCTIIDEIKHVITKSSQRKGELAERAKSEDFDSEEAELLREERDQEAEIFRNVSDILSTLIKASKAAFLPFLDEISSYLMPYMTAKDAAAAERRTWCFIFVDILEHCGEAAPKMRFMDLRLVQNIVVLLSDPLLEIIPTWLNCLPIKGDWTEAKLVHDKLCSMVERHWTSLLKHLSSSGFYSPSSPFDKGTDCQGRSDREVLGLHYEHLPEIMSIFAEVLCAREDLATKDTANRMINVLRDLQKTVPQAIWALAWSLLLPQQEMELESVLSPEEDTNFSSAQ